MPLDSIVSLSGAWETSPTNVYAIGTPPDEVLVVWQGGVVLRCSGVD